MTKRTRKRRVLAKILSRHSTRDLPCKFPEQIYYSKSQKQQRKAGIEYVRKYKDKEWQEDQDEGTGVKIIDNGLNFYFHFLFDFSFPLLFFSFSIFRTTRVRGYQSRCHISHNLMA